MTDTEPPLTRIPLGPDIELQIPAEAHDHYQRYLQEKYSPEVTAASM